MLKRFFKFCWNNLIMRNFIFILLATFILFGIVMLSLGIYTQHGKEITLPDLRRLSIEEAASTLEKYHLQHEVIDSVFRKGATPGSVVDQLPAPGLKVKENRIIYLTVNSNNVQKMSVPRLKDLSHRQAVALLADMGFQVKEIKYVDSPYRDLVIDVLYKFHSVAEGERIPSGSALTLLVGNGGYTPDSTTTTETDTITENTSEGWSH